MRQRGDARRWCVVTLCLALSSALAPQAARAQRAFDLQVGSWTADGPNPTLYSAALWRQLSGPLGFSIQGLALVGSDSAGGSAYGLGPAITLFRGPGRSAPYVVGGVALAACSGGSSDVAALWYVGAGLEIEPLSWLALAVEGGRLVEGGDFRGFWNLEEDDRRGWALSARLSLRWANRSPGGGGAPRAALPEPLPLSSEPAEPLGASGSALARQVVETALSAMGEPYRWGGTSSEEGFDCSGLIWYAYTSHGVSVPRVSRDQAVAGRSVFRDLTALEPGDILLFANGGRAVSHVGLYLGSARFIHATTSGGVRVSSLSPYDDAFDGWWFERWVGARRVLR